MNSGPQEILSDLHPLCADLYRDGRKLELAGRLIEVVLQLEKQLDAEDVVGEPAHIAVQNRRLAVYLVLGGQEKKGLSVLERSMAVAQAGDEMGEFSESKYALGRQLIRTGESDRAIRVLEEDAKYEAELDHRGLWLAYLLDLARAYSGARRPGKARSTLEIGMALANERELPGQRARYLDLEASLFVREDKLKEADETLRKCIASAEEAEEGSLVAYAFANLAWVLDKKRDYDGVRDCFERSVKAAEEVGDLAQLSRSLDGWADSCRRGRLYGKARELTERRLEVVREIGDRTIEAQVLEKLAQIYRDQGNLALADSTLRDALGLAKARDDNAQVASIYLALGDILHQKGEEDEAIEMLKTAVEVHKERAQPWDEFRARCRLGDVLLELKRSAFAQSSFDLALSLAEKMNNQELVARALSGKVAVMEQKGELKWAAVALDKLLNLYRELGDPVGGARTLRMLGLTHHEEGRDTQALELFRNSLRASEASNKSRLIAESHAAIANCQVALKNPKEAVKSFKDAARRYLEAGRSRDAAATLEQMRPHLHQPNQFPSVVKETAATQERNNSPWGRTRGLLEAGRLLMHFGLLEDAEGLFQKALPACAKSHDPRVQGAGLQVLGQVNRYAGNPQKAIGFLNQRVDLERGRANERDLAYALNSLGAAQVDAGTIPGGIESFKEALDLMEQVEDQVGVAVVLNGLAMPLHLDGASEEALESLGRGLEIQEKGQRRNDVSVTLNTRGEILRELGRTTEALDDLERCFQIVDEQGDERGLSFVLPRLGRVRIAAGKKADGFADLHRGVEVAGRNPDRRQIVRAEHALGDALIESGETDDGRKELEKALDRAEKMEERILTDAIKKSLESVSGGGGGAAAW